MRFDLAYLEKSWSYLHSMQLAESWNPQNFDILPLTQVLSGGFRLTLPGREVTIQPYPPLRVGNDWGSLVGGVSGATHYSGPNFATNQDYMDCICACDPARKVDNIPNDSDPHRRWYFDTKAWYDKHFNEDCNTIALDITNKTENKDTTWWASDYLHEKWRDESANYSGSFMDPNPWNLGEWLEWINAANPRGRYGCPDSRKAIAMLQTRECMLECCHLHVWN